MDKRMIEPVLILPRQLNYIWISTVQFTQPFYNRQNSSISDIDSELNSLAVMVKV